MKVWISHYALSKGIEECDVVTTFDSGNVEVTGYPWNVFLLGKGAHTTREAALAAAEQMRLAKIASLKKQIAKLEKMTFAEDAK